ncbi:MAG: hypothetical protein ACLQVF_34790 [Isosphaeraceae bacterium]
MDTSPKPNRSDFRAPRPRKSGGSQAGAVLVPDTAPAAAAALAGPPPPAPVVQCLGVEVTQVIQEMAHSVSLIAGKETLVRVYLDVHAGSRIPVRGVLSVSDPAGSAGGLGTVTSIDSVLLNPAGNGNLRAKRADLGLSLNFRIPVGLTAVGGRVFALDSLRRADTGEALDVPAGASRTATFGQGVPLRVRVLGIRFRAPGGPTEYEPTDLDFDLIRSWLGRAYPTPTVVWSRATVDGPKDWPFNADDVNAFLRAVRFQDVAAGTDARTHYYGVVADGGAGGPYFMRGKASAVPGSPDPSAVASGPTGVPSGNFAWDTDGSYGDWYAGHELGHTFGRPHAEFCGATDGAPYPFPNGQLSGANEEFVGLDVGDSAYSIPPRALPGTQWHDLMTYCANEWPSSFSYGGIMARLAVEAGLAPNPPAPAQPVAALAAALDAATGPGPFSIPVAGPPAGTIHLVAKVDLARGTGSFEQVQPYPGLVPPPDHAPPGRTDDGRTLSLRLVDAAGQILSQVPAPFFPNVCGKARLKATGKSRPSAGGSTPAEPAPAAAEEDHDSEGSRGLVDAKIALLDAAAAIYLVLGDEVLDKFARGATPASITSIRPDIPPAFAAAAAGLAPFGGGGTARPRAVVTWDTRAVPAPGGEMGAALGPTEPAPPEIGRPNRYSVQLSADDGLTWRTIGMGLKAPRVTIDRNLLLGVASVRLRVTSTDGFRRTVAEQTLPAPSL